MILRILPAPLFAALLAACAADPQACRVETVADLPLLPHVNITAVPATYQDQKVALLIDTGAFGSTVSRSSAQRFDLRPGGDARYATVEGIGGSASVPIVTVRGLGLGHGRASSLELPVAADFPRPVDGLPVFGLFGADFLSNYDVDVDLPRQHFGLYKATNCDPAMRPFDPPYLTVPFRLQDNQITIDVRLNGHAITAILDTGASSTVIDQADAAAAGVTADLLNSDATRHAVGVDTRTVDVRRHRFGSLEVGDERLNNFSFDVGGLQTGTTLLGRDFLRHNRVLISYGRRTLFIQPISTIPPS